MAKPRYTIETEGDASWLVIRIPISLLPEKISIDVGDAAKIRLDLLTVREREVFNLIVQHKANKEIADELNIEVRTVKFHVSEVLRKLCVDSRAQLWFLDK